MPYFSRLDISVYNEATGFLIASEGLAGHKYDSEPLGSEWQQLVREGVFLPVSLVTDNCPIFRVILNDTLTEQEKEECVDHFAAKLLILDGRLALIGGCEYIWGEDAEEFMKVLDVPPAEYRVDVYTCFTGINGPDLYWGNYEVDAGQPGATNDKGTGGPLQSEPVGSWFRRTRPQEDFPQWLVEHCYEDPRSDPGHEQFWYDYEDVYEDDDNEPGFVDFIVQLRKIDSVPPPPDILPLLEEDWIPCEINLQLPVKCPRGLQANNRVND
jgi:hypothetical protein